MFVVVKKWLTREGLKPSPLTHTVSQNPPRRCDCFGLFTPMLLSFPRCELGKTAYALSLSYRALLLKCV